MVSTLPIALSQSDRRDGQTYASSRRAQLFLIEEFQHCGAVFVVARVVGQSDAITRALQFDLEAVQ